MRPVRHSPATPRHPLAKICVALCLALSISACDQAPAPEPAKPAAPEVAPWRKFEPTLNASLEEQSDKRLRRLTVSATGFADAIDGLLDDTTPERLATAQQAWSHLYLSFNESFVMLLCRSTENPVDIARVQRADSFPILPGYIDGLSEWPESGIVNDTALPLTREALLEQQDATLEGESSIGLQVIHFLLHGEPGVPRTADALKAVTERTDDMIGEISEQPNNRRRLYLQLATELLVEDLTQLARDDKAPKTITRECPVGALRETVARLLQLDGLRDHNHVGQDFIADNVRTAASTGLQNALTPWLKKDSALFPWLDAHESGASANLKPAPDLNDKNRVKKLQALHAALASTQQMLKRY
ncbi:MAG: imelysin family protein [Alcanivoracaceae bacterium]|nr:imelysin family protein [Alcanivoracaceae bacterium]